MGHTDLLHRVPCQERPDATLTDSTSPKPWALIPLQPISHAGDGSTSPGPIRGAPGPRVQIGTRGSSEPDATRQRPPGGWARDSDATSCGPWGPYPQPSPPEMTAQAVLTLRVSVTPSPSLWAPATPHPSPLPSRSSWIEAKGSRRRDTFLGCPHPCRPSCPQTSPRWAPAALNTLAPSVPTSHQSEVSAWLGKALDVFE